MPKIFLSPSTQEFNPYIIGGNEEYYMNLIADEMIPYLKASNIDFDRNDPLLTAKDAAIKANKNEYDLYLALHSNASPDRIKGILKGTDAYYYPFSKSGERAANIIANGIKTIYPNPKLVNTRTTTTLIEVTKSKAPAVLLEIAYHDNKEDALWIVDNIENIAKNITSSIADFLSVPFYTSNSNKKGIVVINNGRLRVRNKPSLDSRIIGYLKNREMVQINKEINGFYQIRFNGGTGYAKSDFIAII